MNDTDERFLWSMIELAWKKAEEGVGEAPGPLRKAILGGAVTDFEDAMRPFCWALEDLLRDTFTRDGLLSFAEAFETMVFRLDREELGARVGLGDDGFLEARFFIVAMGEDYCARVLRTPGAALPLATAEQAYMGIHRAYQERFHEPYPRFGIALTTGSNMEGWPTLRARGEQADRIGHATDEVWLALGLSGSHTPVSRLVRIPALSQEDLEGVLLRLAARLRERQALRGG